MAAATPSFCMACGRSTSGDSRKAVERVARPFVPQPVIDGMLDVMPSKGLIIHRVSQARHVLRARSE